jgi:dihydroorotate dehydrogenase
MSWYRALGRPLFFSLPPETAHRLAGRLLDLPLPWSRIGGASTDPALERTVAGLALRNPVGLAAGFDKTCAHLDALGAVGFGYVVGGTLTSRPRGGNPKPRIVRYRERGSMTNAMGLPNPGVPAVADALATGDAGARTARRLVSLADEDEDDVRRNLELLLPMVDGFELNVSCPNVAWGRDVDNETHLARLLRAARDRGGKPLFVKLPPFETPAERDAVLTLARLAADGGADGVTSSNTRPVGDLRLSTGRGGVSGRAVFSDTLRIVGEMREALGDALPIHACGGISSAKDALACLEAGASTVQVYSALIFEGAGVIGSITHGLAEALRRRYSSPSAAAASTERQGRSIPRLCCPESGPPSR